MHIHEIKCDIPVIKALKMRAALGFDLNITTLCFYVAGGVIEKWNCFLEDEQRLNKSSFFRKWDIEDSMHIMSSII